MVRPPTNPIHLYWPRAAGSEKTTRYEIAGVELVSNRELPELEPFRSGWAAAELPGSASVIRVSADLPVVYDGRGWVGGRDVAVICRAEGRSYRLEVGSRAVVEIAERENVVQIKVPGEVRDKDSRLAVLGPGLALALALGGRFSLHAGAFLRRRRAVLVLGESGAGKSTLSAAFEAQRTGSRLADDILPVSVDVSGRLAAHPRFPQLKLGSEDQWLGARDVEVAEVLLLRRDRRSARLTDRRFSAREAALRLIENTVACRLFGPGLRIAHLDAFTAAAMVVPISDLSVPDGLDRLSGTIAYLRGEGRP